jgi:nucleotide-binding universal stress UspA family protein
MLKKILVPLDGSEMAASVLPQVIDLAKAFNAQVTLMHVCYSPVGAEIGESSPEVIRQAAAIEKKACEAFLGKTANDMKAQGVEIEALCVEGVPAREIIAYADKNGMDLIAMATHGRGEVAWVMGSVAERVITHATVPVLLHRVIKPKMPALKEEFFLP